MATLDIRAVGNEADEIVFGEGQIANGMKLVKSNRKGEFMLYDLENDRTGYLDTVDIDNLILALQKAKELWGSK